MKIRLSRKFIAVFFTLCMVISIVPFPAFAVGGDKDISEVSIDSVSSELWSYKDVTFATIDENSGYTIESQKWVPLFSDGSSKDITPDSENKKPVANTTYNFSMILKAKDGYVFTKSDDSWLYGGVLNINGQQYSNKIAAALKKEEDRKKLHIDLMGFAKAEGNISNVVIENVKFDYQVGDIPQKTASVAPSDAEKYKITCEYWTEIENGNSVAFWYSDDSKYTSSTKRVTKFEEGKSYVYSVDLETINGEAFMSKVIMTLNGETKSGLNILVDIGGKNLYATNLKTIQPIKFAIEKKIDLIEIKDVTVNFKPGDKPVFTGNTGDFQPYFIDHERWDTEGAGVASSAYWNNFYGNFEGSWGKRIEAFEAGKEYHYGVYLKLTQNGYAEGWRFDKNTKLYINGQSVDLSNKRVDVADDGLTIWFNDVLTITPEESGTISNYDYKIIEGANSSWVQNADKTLTFRINGDLSKFVGIKVNDEWVDKENYTVASGSTIVTLKNEYLKTLSEGEHKITFVYTDGEVSTNFEVKESGKIYENSDNPKTGDNTNILIWISLFAANALSMLGIIVYNKKKKSIV